MTYLELIEKLRQDLADYTIGLHNISVSKYQSIMRFTMDRHDEFKLTCHEVSKTAIAMHIINTGLQVYDQAFGLRSTVTFLKSLDTTSLDYNYNDTKEYVTNIIVGIPNYITYNNQKYYLGDLSSYVNIANLIFFNPTLPPEFIYGCYQRAIINTNNELFGKERYTFADEIRFFENPLHYQKKSLLEQREIIQKLLASKKHNIRCLKLANNDQPILPVFTTSFERHAIIKTREQIKELKKVY